MWNSDIYTCACVTPKIYKYARVTWISRKVAQGATFSASERTPCRMTPRSAPPAGGTGIVGAMDQQPAGQADPEGCKTVFKRPPLILALHAP